MIVAQVDFASSKAAQEQREVRRMIRNAKRDLLTKSERDILMALVNLWFYHRSGPTGEIHPGCRKLAKKAKVSEVTVKRALTKFRATKMVKAIAYESGGRNATKYRVSIDAISAYLDPSEVVIATGELVPFPQRHSRSNDTVSEGQNDTVYPYQNDTRYIRGVEQAPDASDFLPISESLIDYGDEGAG